MTNDEDLRRFITQLEVAADHCDDTGLRSGGHAIREAIERLRAQPSALINEVAEKIANDIYHVLPKWADVTGIIQSALADFKRAIELDARGKGAVAEPELKGGVNGNIEALILRMKQFIAGMRDIRHHAWAKTSERLIAALEQQIAVLNDPAALHIHILRNWDRERIKSVALHLLGDTSTDKPTGIQSFYSGFAADAVLEVERLEKQVEVAKGALERTQFVLARIIDDLPHSRDWLDPALEREAVAIANGDKPTESGITVLATSDLPDGYPEWFQRVYGYARTQTLCVVALSRCTISDFYYLVNAALRELNVEPTEGGELIMDPDKRERLEAKGWKFGTAEEFLDSIGEPIHDWQWALARMKEGKRVKLPSWISDSIDIGSVAGSPHGWFRFSSGRIASIIPEWLERCDWQPVEDTSKGAG